MNNDANTRRYRVEWCHRAGSSRHGEFDVGSYQHLPSRETRDGWYDADWILFDNVTGEVVDMGNDYFKVAVHLGMKEASK